MQQLLIGDEWREAEGGASFERVDPFTGETATVAAAASPRDADAAVEAAAGAFAEWSAKPPAERRAILDAAAGLIDERAAEIAAAMTEETGAHVRLGHVQLLLAAGIAARGGRHDHPDRSAR